MILSGEQIRMTEIVQPHEEKAKHNGMSYGESSCGYDIRIGDLPHGEFEWTLLRGDFILAGTFEQFDMPLNVCGIVHDKSTWVRQGLTVQNTVLEPSWCGFLTLELINHGRKPLTVRVGDPIAQVIFHRIEGRVEPYKGKYQGQARGPQEARFDE